jgi:pimeloyl-ACP methyl ester carboxylesterase
MELKQANLRNVSLGYYDCGEGRPLLFLHGFGAEITNKKVLTLKKYYGGRLILSIYPGYKGSGKWRRKYSINNIVDCLFELMDSLGVREFDLVGHSFGTIVASQFAKKHSEMVKKLVLVGAPTTNSPLFKKVKKYRRIVPITRFRVGGKVVQTMAKVVLRKDKESRKMVLNTIKGLTSIHDRRALANNASEIFKTNFENLYKEIPKETLFIYGDKDNTCLVSDCSDFLVRVIPGGHSVMFDNPEEFFSKVYEFFDS